MPNNAYYGHLEPVLTGISQETKQNFVEELVFFGRLLCLDWKSSRWTRSFFYQVVNPNFKFPQVWRTSLGYDHFDRVITFDGRCIIKWVCGLVGKNNKPVVGADVGAIYGANDQGRTDYGFPSTNGYVLTTKKSAFNTSIKIQIFDNGLFASLGYNYLKSLEQILLKKLLVMHLLLILL
jgi:hypothetical protein